MDATLIRLRPGTPAWQSEMTASKVAAVLGLSPWDSPLSMWYKMAGYVPPEPQKANQERGHYLEPAVAQWVADQYGLTIYAGRCWRNRGRPWQVASPDRLVYEHRSRRQLVESPVAVLEAKTAADWEEWGPDGSDEVPGYYRAQVVWQCDTLGLDTGYLGVLLPRLAFRGYVIHPAPGEAQFIRDRCRDFLDSIEAGNPPDIDGHDETYRVLRKLNPDVDKDDWVAVAPDEARAYCNAVERLRIAEDEHTYERSLMAKRMGKASRAVVDEELPEGAKPRVVAYRQAGAAGVDPYVKPPQTARLPYRLGEEA